MRSEQEVVLGIVRIADALTRRLVVALEPLQLTLTQYSALESLRLAGDGGLTCRELAGRLVTRDPDVTRLLDRLEVRGLVSRRRGQSDRRVVRTHITAEGSRLLADVAGPVDGRAGVLAPLGERKLTDLLALLRAAEALT
jgi:DNA-binding MarR family transcriptional regulator